MANQLQSDRTAETNSNQKMMITLTRSANQVFDYITSFFAEFKLVSKMTILRLLKITPSHKRGDNHYTWHIGNRVGNGEYVCQYTVDRLHSHSASLKCINRAGTKLTEPCSARVTVTFRADIWPFVQIIKQNKNGPKYGFVGGADVTSFDIM